MKAPALHFSLNAKAVKEKLKAAHKKTPKLKGLVIGQKGQIA
jgi:hypothetical protein